MSQPFINLTETYSTPETFTEATTVIGQIPNQVDHFATRILTGQWDYPQDIFPGQKLFTGVQFCPYAHALITGIDTTAAAAMPGVKAIVTYMEVPSPAMPKPAAGLTTSEITYEGTIVAAVAATDPWLAHSAAANIKVTYTVLPFVVDMDAAIATGAPPAVGTISSAGVWTGTTPNYLTTTAVNTGNVDANMALATTVWQDTIGWASYFHHNTPEPRDATCQWVGNELWEWCGSQQPTGDITATATALGINESNIHFTSHGMGGGYGDRKPNGEEGWIAALLAKKAGMPVNTMFSRHVNATGGATHQSQQKATIKVGCQADGTINAIDAQWEGTTGNIALQLTYATANLRITGTPITTNVPRTGPYRSVNGMHSCFCSDQVMDQMAYQLGMNPLAFRLKVAVTPSMVDQATGLPLGCVALTQVLNQVATNFNWAGSFHSVGSKTLPDGRLDGVGSCYTVSEKGSSSPGRTVVIRMATDGSVMVNCGIGAAASGTHTALGVVVAEALGVTMDKVNVMVGDILTSGYGSSQAGSQGTCSNAYGAYEAAKVMLGTLMTSAAKTLKTTTDQLTASGNKIFITSTPTSYVTHAQAVGGNCLISKGDGTVLGAGFKIPVLNWPVGTSNTVRTYVAEMAEIAVDQETGQIQVLNWHMVHNIGTALFPKGVQAQLNGGMCQQYSWAITGWEQLFDPTTGATLNGNFINQKVATSLDLPIAVMHPTYIQVPNAASVYGAMGCGEPPDICYATLHNAFYNATGKRIKNTCMYPARVLAALGVI
jgi:CO/xanthine dehydrogenase Mo-binding subunit